MNISTSQMKQENFADYIPVKFMLSKRMSAEEDIWMINGWERIMGTVADNASSLQKNKTKTTEKKSPKQ